MIRTLPLLALAACMSAEAAEQRPEQIAGHALAPCEGGPVYMVVAGETHDRPRMLAYGQAIRDSGLYERLGGYYINVPVPVATFEGGPESHVTLIVRFPCLANAQAFWYSWEYQEEIKPLRLNPSAGDYAVKVYPQAELPPYMAGRVAAAPYLGEADEPRP